MLTSEQKRFWDEKGYLVLPKFFSTAELDTIVCLHQHLWQEYPEDIVVDDLKTGRRSSLALLANAKDQPRLKINDLFLNYEEMRQLSLNASLVAILADLLPDAPVLCNTLSLDYGSQQPLHIDSMYMTPLTDYHLVATWIALEDCHPDAGPLRYLPGSHKIPIYRFSNGSACAIESEMAQWNDYIQQKVQQLGLQEETFLPKAGDVFIWHAQLLHGGSKINDLNRTRKSIVSHYYTKNDCLQMERQLVPFGKAYWMKRPPHTIPEQRIPRSWIQLTAWRTEHILRTTLHYVRLWKRDIFRFPE